MTAVGEHVNVWEGVKRRPILALLPVLVFVAVGVALGVARKPVYSATARMYVQVPASDPSALFSLTDAASGLASAYSRAVSATVVVDAVARDLSMDPGAVAGKTAATPVPDSPVVKVIAQGSTAHAATRLANTTAQELRRYITRLNDSAGASRTALGEFGSASRGVARAQARVLQAQNTYDALGTSDAKVALDTAQANLQVALLRRETARERYSTLQSGQQPTLEVLRQADSAGSDHGSKLKLFAFIGLLAGAVVGAALATLANSLDRRLRSGEEVADELDLPLLARLPESPRRVTKRGKLAMLDRPQGDHAEALRLLRANLEFAVGDGPAQVIMFVSPVGADPKSETAANLGVALARRGERVVLVDLDLRRPRIAKYFRLPSDVGVSDVVLGRSNVMSAVSHVALNGKPKRGGDGNGILNGGAGLDVLPAGPVPSNPGDFLGSSELPALFAELRNRYDVVLVDTPPALAVGDAIVASKLADALVVVARPGDLSRPHLRELHRRLDASPTRKLGVVAIGDEATTVRY